MLKGGRDGVAIVIDEQASIEAAIAELRAKLSEVGQLLSRRRLPPRCGAAPFDGGRARRDFAIVREFGIELREPRRTPRETPASGVSPLRQRESAAFRRPGA